VKGALPMSLFLFVAKYEGGERRLDVLEFVAVCRAIRATPSGPKRFFKRPDVARWDGPSL
jgi:hypothetical protein